MAKNARELESGWTIETGDIYHFGHVDREWAEAEIERRAEELYAVEVINGTIAQDGSLHLNTFFAWGYADALGLAARMQLAPYPDTVLNIRPATEEEERCFYGALNHFRPMLDHGALPEERAAELADESD